MDLQSNLIESSKHGKKRGGWKASLASLGVHSGIIAFVLVMGATATHRVSAEDKPIRAFMASHAAPPPPPPPPPPPAASSTPKATPKVTPVQVPKQTFVQPREIPKQMPKTTPVATTTVANTTPDPSPSDDGGQQGGVPGGVAGGVVGGVQGGVVGGQVGGVLGGELGGVKGGVVGGQVGGTGTEPAPAPEPKKDDGPLRVGGDVKAPTVTHRVDPIYPDMARKTRIAGVVILEAVINKDGEVEQVRVLKGLPMGLSDNAEAAVKQWKFKPGTLNGQPVDVIFNLTVNFKLD